MQTGAYNYRAPHQNAGLSAIHVYFEKEVPDMNSAPF